MTRYDWVLRERERGRERGKERERGKNVRREMSDHYTCTPSYRTRVFIGESNIWRICL